MLRQGLIRCGGALLLLTAAACGGRSGRAADALNAASAEAFGAAEAGNAAAGSAGAASVKGTDNALAALRQPDAPEELPLPEIPAALREPRQRAGYVVEHFWDALDFRDTLRTRNEAFMEQNFVNFVALFPHADERSLPRAVTMLLRRAKPASELWYSLTELAEKYLYEPNSPLYDERSYTLFLEAIIATEGLDDASKIRPRAQLAEMALNRPGSTAPDFSWLRPDGSTGSLYATRAERTLLFFYDAECEQCAAEIEWLRSDPRITALTASGRLAVAAVCVDGTPEAWRRKLPALDAAWTIGYAAAERFPEGRYVLRAVPSFYLLDAEKRVLLKDASPAAVVAELAE